MSIVNKFIDKLDILIIKKTQDDQLDYIFKHLDDLCIKNDFYIVDDILKNIDIKKYDITIILGILTVLYPYGKNLNHRLKFFDNSKEHFSTKYGTDEIKQLFNGLDGEYKPYYFS